MGVGKQQHQKAGCLEEVTDGSYSKTWFDRNAAHDHGHASCPQDDGSNGGWQKRPTPFNEQTTRGEQDQAGGYRDDILRSASTTRGGGRHDFIAQLPREFVWYESGPSPSLDGFLNSHITHSGFRYWYATEPFLTSM
jgi:hypothetical protein